jgi:hypothetical protein
MSGMWGLWVNPRTGLQRHFLTADACQCGHFEGAGPGISTLCCPDPDCRYLAAGLAACRCIDKVNTDEHAVDTRIQIAGNDFVWDIEKAESNRFSHGIRFEDAATVFLDPLFKVLDGSRRGQPRQATTTEEAEYAD